MVQFCFHVEEQKSKQISTYEHLFHGYSKIILSWWYILNHGPDLDEVCIKTTQFGVNNLFFLSIEAHWYVDTSIL